MLGEGALGGTAQGKYIAITAICMGALIKLVGVVRDIKEAEAEKKISARGKGNHQ